jgi:hypothetical protein
VEGNGPFLIDVISRNLSGGTLENHDSMHAAEIRTEHISNTCLECFCSSNLFGMPYCIISCDVTISCKVDNAYGIFLLLEVLVRRT